MCPAASPLIGVFHVEQPAPVDGVPTVVPGRLSLAPGQPKDARIPCSTWNMSLPERLRLLVFHVEHKARARITWSETGSGVAIDLRGPPVEDVPDVPRLSRPGGRRIGCRAGEI